MKDNTDTPADTDSTPNTPPPTENTSDPLDEDETQCYDW